jgi:CheY-like chemotaxis protein
MPNTKASLLIVDDEPSIRTSLALVLTEIGYSVRSAQDGVAALAEIQHEVPEILLSDLNMPGMSGYELLSVVRHRFSTVRTVAMSGAFSGDEVPSGVAADAFYQKGSSLGSLLMIISTLPQMERRPVQPCRAPEPPSIHGHRNNFSAKAPSTITCPQCHRDSPLALDGFGSMMRQANCTFCGNSMQYTIVEPSNHSISKEIQRNGRAADPAQNASVLSN